METRHANSRHARGLSRRDLLKAGLAAGVTVSAWPLSGPPTLWGGEAGPPKRGGILRVRGFDPPNFDHHLTTAGFTQSAASFVYSKLVRHKVGAAVPPGTFIIEPDLAERWEELDDTTYVFHLRQGVKWHNKPPVNGREFVAEDVKFTFDRFLTEKGSPNRYLLDAVDRIELDCGPGINWAVRQQDLEALKKSHPHLIYQDFLSQTSSVVTMRTDTPPFNDVRVRRAISHAIDRAGINEAVWLRGAPTPAVSRGLVEWSLPIDQLGEGAKYYRYDPQEARRLLAEAGYPKGFKTTLTVTSGLGRDRIDEAQLVQRYLKDVGIEAALKIQEHGAYTATTVQGKFEGLVDSPSGVAWEPDGRLYRAYAADSSRNMGHVNDAALTAMLKEQQRTKDVEARKKIIHDIQRYVAEQQYYVYLNSNTITTSWQPYVKNFAHNHSFDYGNRAAALWLDR